MYKFVALKGADTDRRHQKTLNCKSLPNALFVESPNIRFSVVILEQVAGICYWLEDSQPQTAVLNIPLPIL